MKDNEFESVRIKLAASQEEVRALAVTVEKFIDHVSKKRGACLNIGGNVEDYDVLLSLPTNAKQIVADFRRDVETVVWEAAADQCGEMADIFTLNAKETRELEGLAD